MNGNKLLNIPPPENDGDAVNLEYVDTKYDDVKRYVNALTPFSVKEGKYSAVSQLNMNGFTLVNVGEPVDPKNVATKEYADKYAAFQFKNGGYEATANIYFARLKIGGLRDPKKGGEAANKRYVDEYVKEYVDEYVEKFKDGNGNFVLPSDVNVADKKLFGLPTPTAPNDAATKEYADRVGINAKEYADRSSELLGNRVRNLPFAFVKENGNYAANAPINMVFHPLENLPEPKETSDAATKKYVDDIVADNVGNGNMSGNGSPFFKENGNFQATHNINMAFKQLLNVPTPGEPFQAATKKYVDDVVTDNSVPKEYIDTEINAVREYVDNEGAFYKGEKWIVRGIRGEVLNQEDVFHARGILKKDYSITTSVTVYDDDDELVSKKCVDKAIEDLRKYVDERWPESG